MLVEPVPLVVLFDFFFEKVDCFVDSVAALFFAIVVWRGTKSQIFVGIFLQRKVGHKFISFGQHYVFGFWVDDWMHSFEGIQCILFLLIIQLLVHINITWRFLVSTLRPKVETFVKQESILVCRRTVVIEEVPDRGVMLVGAIYE